MSLPRIYADFNGLDRSPRRPERFVVALDTHGSLDALARAGLELHDGLRLTIWDASDEEEDLEADITVYYDAARRVWLAEMDEEGYRYVPAIGRSP
jgi:hypothetical protein